MSTIFGTLAAGLKSKADALDAEINEAFTAQAAADENYADAKTEIYDAARNARAEENDAKIEAKTEALAKAKAEKEEELAALIGISTDAGDRILPATVFGAINQLAVENTGWNDYQEAQYKAALEALEEYESEVLGSAEDFTEAVGYAGVA
jgi:hypothetical protein|tara:strand:+ start:984 stop:1436 length:453 start_codon:yes stop_codon:yes gene_type:complete